MLKVKNVNVHNHMIFDATDYESDLSTKLLVRPCLSLLSTLSHRLYLTSSLLKNPPAEILPTTNF